MFYRVHTNHLIVKTSNYTKELQNLYNRIKYYIVKLGNENIVHSRQNFIKYMDTEILIPLFHLPNINMKILWVLNFLRSFVKHLKFVINIMNNLFSFIYFECNI